MEELPPESTRAGAFLRRILPFAFRAHYHERGQEGIQLHSAVALLSIVQPELFHSEKMAGDVEIRGDLTKGATIFDRPPVTEIAGQKLAEEGLTDRVELVNGDFYADALPVGHDLALLSAIIHQNDTEQNVELYRKVFDSLVPGGTLVVRDFVMSEDHTEPPDGAFFAVNMLVNTPGGSTYSFEDIRKDLETAAFADIRLLHRAEMDSPAPARKPV